jgi:hypothetical protein
LLARTDIGQEDDLLHGITGEGCLGEVDDFIGLLFDGRFHGEEEDLVSQFENIPFAEDLLLHLLPVDEDPVARPVVLDGDAIAVQGVDGLKARDRSVQEDDLVSRPPPDRHPVFDIVRLDDLVGDFDL